MLHVPLPRDPDRAPRLSMPLLTCLFLSGQTHHVIQRGSNRQPVFSPISTGRSSLAGSRGAAAASLRAPCLCAGDQPRASVADGGAARCAAAADAVAELTLCRYVGYVNRVYGRSGTLWEGRYKSTIVGNEAWVLACDRGQFGARRHGRPARGSPMVELARQRRGPARPAAERASDLPGARANASGAPGGLPRAVRGGARRGNACHPARRDPAWRGSRQRPFSPRDRGRPPTARRPAAARATAEAGAAYGGRSTAPPIAPAAENITLTPFLTPFLPHGLERRAVQQLSH